HGDPATMAGRVGAGAAELGCGPPTGLGLRTTLGPSCCGTGDAAACDAGRTRVATETVGTTRDGIPCAPNCQNPNTKAPMTRSPVRDASNLLVCLLTNLEQAQDV